MALLLVALTLLASGCFLRLSVGNVDPYGDGQLRFGAGIADCTHDITDVGSDVGCTYTLFDENGFLVAITGSAELVTTYGVFGLLIDPVVLQVPEDLTVIQAIYDHEQTIGPLDVTRTTVFDAAPGETVRAEAGQVFLILDLPPGAADAAAGAEDAQSGPTFGFTLSFSVAELRPLLVKPMFTAHVVEDGRHYFPPLLPCSTDFSDVPALQVPVDFTGQDLGPALADLAQQVADLGCRDRVYRFATGPVTRLAGPDRVATAIDISQATFGAHQAASVVVARADDFPDALAGAPLARAQAAPILLTGTAGLDPQAAEELQRVAPPGSTVFLLGGTAALSDQVAADVEALGYGVQRLAGSNRFATAAAIASYSASPEAPLFLADGGTFQAALLAGNSAAREFSAVLLTDGATLPDDTRAYLQDHPEQPRIAIGPAAIAAAPDAEPIAGDDPATLSVNVAERIWGDDITTAALASAATFPDGLTGGPHSADRRAPLLLTDPATLSAPLRSYLQARSQVDRVFVYGGDAAVASAVTAEVTDLIAGR